MSGPAVTAKVPLESCTVQLSGLGSSSPRRRGYGAACNPDTQDCQNKRQRAENEILPAALGDEVRNCANRHDDSKKPRSQPKQRCIASPTPYPPTAEHDQCSGDIDNGSNCARSSLGRREVWVSATPSGLPPSAPAASAAWNSARAMKPIAATTAANWSTRLLGLIRLMSAPYHRRHGGAPALLFRAHARES